MRDIEDKGFFFWKAKKINCSEGSSSFGCKGMACQILAFSFFEFLHTNLSLLSTLPIPVLYISIFKILRACLVKTERGATVSFCDFFTCRKGCGNGHLYGATEGNGCVQTRSN